VEISVATYHSPTCNDHVPLEQAADTTCVYCKITEYREALEKIAKGQLTDHDAWMTARWTLGFPDSAQTPQSEEYNPCPLCGINRDRHVCDCKI
jgi:hypothetical protein